VDFLSLGYLTKKKFWSHMTWERRMNDDESRESEKGAVFAEQQLDTLHTTTSTLYVFLSLSL
jgi:hypothetical protein